MGFLTKFKFFGKIDNSSTGDLAENRGGYHMRN